jgi:hypothetical protein
MYVQYSRMIPGRKLAKLYRWFLQYREIIVGTQELL